MSLKYEPSLAQVAIFLRKLLPDMQISRVHVHEWLQLFGQDGRELEPMRWLHMKKVLLHEKAPF